MTVRRKILLCAFPGTGITNWEPENYLASLEAQLENDSRFYSVMKYHDGDTPITCNRNRALCKAEQNGADFVLMIDSDMVPDVEMGADKYAKPFFDSSIEFMLKQDTPCIVAAPYCGPPPGELCYVFHWVRRQHHGDPDPNFAIEMIPRTEAARMTGIHNCEGTMAALPTGLILIDVRGLARMPHPRFYYEWKDETETEKASTEDVVFTRDWANKGLHLFCNWDAWAGHIKRKVVRRPRLMQPDSVPRLLRKTAKEADRLGLPTPPNQSPVPRIRPENWHKQLPPGAKPGRILTVHSDVDPEPEYKVNEPSYSGAEPATNCRVHVDATGNVFKAERLEDGQWQEVPLQKNEQGEVVIEANGQQVMEEAK